MSYRARLQNVRAELVEIERLASDVVKSESSGDDSQLVVPSTSIGKLAAATCGIARILIRVIDVVP